MTDENRYVRPEAALALLRWQQLQWQHIAEERLLPRLCAWAMLADGAEKDAALASFYAAVEIGHVELLAKVHERLEALARDEFE